MGGKCSGSRKKKKDSTKCNMPSPHNNGFEQYYSADIHHLLPNVQHSKPLYRFSHRDQVNRVDLNARIIDIRDVEDDLRMESMFLKQNNNVPLGRCSTPDPSYCHHCDHKHRSRCCLYLGDAEDDINRYSAWTQDFEKTPAKPQHVKCIPEAVSFNSTPYWFPRYTSIKSDSIRASVKTPPSKQLFQPFQGTSTWKDFRDSNKPTSLTPYQQYIVQLRQLTQETQCHFDRYNPYCNPRDPRHPGINHLMQPFNQHIYNGPIFMQQNNYSPYFNPYSYPCYYDTYQCHQQFASGDVPLRGAIGYQPERQTCILHPFCALKTGHQQPNYQLPMYYASNEQAPQNYANPTAQVHSEGVSFPLWMLFTYNQTKNIGDDSDGKKRFARHFHEPNVDHNSNIIFHPPPNSRRSSPQMDFDNDYEHMNDCQMPYSDVSPN